MKDVVYHEDFVPAGCSETEPTRAMQALGGDQWVSVYREADRQKVNVVGGNAQSVGAAGGYSLGGGHSSMSPAYGLAVDNILEVDIVLADGTLVTANKCQNQDLFWATKGGGGGTFGIVTRMMHQAHDPFDNYYQYLATFTSVSALCKVAKLDCSEIMVDTFHKFLKWTEENQPGQWSGYAVWGHADGIDLMII